MSRLFDDAASDKLELGSAVLTGVPISIAAWFNSDSTALNQGIASVWASGSSTNFFTLEASGGVGGDPVRATTSAGGTTGAAATSAGYTANAWHHACGVFSAINARAAYLNGGSKGTETTSATPASINRTGIGQRRGATFFSGMVAEVGIWNAALTDDDALALARGASPLMVQPAALVGYWPLIGRYSPEIDLRQGNGMTLTGTAAADHPRVIMPLGLWQVGIGGVSPLLLRIQSEGLFTGRSVL